jgi:signal transduction histidine kinase
VKNWHLRWKISLYAALLGVVATVAGACTTWVIMSWWEVSAFDRRLALDAHELFRDIENFAGGPGSHRAVFTEDLVPLALRNRMIEVRGPDGAVLYASANLPGQIAHDGLDKIRTRRIGQRNVRMGTFHENGFTADVGADAHEVNQIGRDIVFGMLGAIPTVLIVVVLGGRWVASRALAPVDAICQAAAAITLKNLEHRLPVPAAQDEIAALVEVLNNMLGRLQGSFEQSMRFSAEASHQLKTPLAVLRADIEAVLHDAKAPHGQAERAEEMLQQVHQLTSIAENLLLLARADSGRLDLQTSRFDLREMLDGVCDDLRALAEPQRLTVETNLAPSLAIVGDRQSVALILQNLAENAVKFSRPEGFVCMHAAAVNGQVQISIRNNGIPIPPAQAPHVFERFYRGRPDGRTSGGGLGLSIASELARAQGGSLELVRSDAEWTEFRLRMPRG